MSSADFAHLKGFGFRLWMSGWSVIAFSGCAVLLWVPRQNCFSAGRANRRLTGLGRDTPGGVKWGWKRGCRAGHWRIMAVLCMPWLSRIRRTSGSAGTALSTGRRKLRNPTERCRRRHAPDTSPVAVLGAANGDAVPWRLWSWVRRSGVPGLMGGIGWVRSNARICDFPSTHCTTTHSGGWGYGDTSRTFPTNSGSRDCLKVPTRWGFRPKARQMRPTVAG